MTGYHVVLRGRLLDALNVREHHCLIYKSRNSRKEILSSNRVYICMELLKPLNLFKRSESQLEMGLAGSYGRFDAKIRLPRIEVVAPQLASVSVKMEKPSADPFLRHSRKYLSDPVLPRLIVRKQA